MDQSGVTKVATSRAARPRVLLGGALALALVGIWALLQFSGLADIPFHSKGEPREAIAVQDVVNSRRYVLPLRNGYEIPRKPPLFYWLGAALGKARGKVDVATARIPSAVQSLLGALLLLTIGAAAGSPLAGFLSALVLLTSFEWLRAAVSARIDMTLALGTTASFAGLFLSRHRPGLAPLLLFYGGMVWGTLAKGPVGILLPTLCAIVALLIESGTRWITPLLGLAVASFLAIQLGAPSTIVVALAGAAFGLLFLYVAWEIAKPLHPIPGYIFVALSTGLWYGLAARAGGDEFVDNFMAENFGRFLGTASIEVGHRHGFGYLVGALAAGFLPWTLLLLFSAPSLARRHTSAGRTLITHSLVWFAVVFAFFSMSGSKRGVYLLPMYPAAACLVGMLLADFWNERAQPRLLWSVLDILALSLAVVGGLVAITFGLDLAGFELRQAIVDPIVAELAGPSTASELSAGFSLYASSITGHALALFAAALALLFFASHRRPRGTVAALFASVIALQVVAQQAVMPAVAVANDRRAFARQVADLAGDRSVTTTPDFDAAVAFHLGGAVPVIDIGGDTSRLDAVTILSREEWLRLSSHERAPFETIPGIRVRKQNNQSALLVVQRVPRRVPKKSAEAPAQN